MNYQELYNHLKALPREEANRSWGELMPKYLQKNRAFSKKQADIIIYAAYERGHSAGWAECMSYANEYATFALDILNAKE